MADFLATFKYDSTLPGDSIAPTLSFAVHKPGAVAPGDGSLILEQIQEAINFTPAGAADSMTSVFSQSINRAVDSGVASVYDITGKLDGSPHGSPIASVGLEADAAAGGGPLPAQLAVCITLRGRNALSYPVEAPPAPPGEPDTQRPRQRHTGRIYFGPINSFFQGASPDGEPRPGAGTIDVLLRGCEQVQDSLNAEGFIWCVWSRKNQAMYGIERVEADDSFDIIRSRKAAPTVRSVRVLNPVPDLALGA